MGFVPPARADGLSSGAGQPPPQSAAIAALLGTICLFLGFGPRGALVGLLILALGGWLLATMATRQVGGQTGDVLGALQQVGEAAILVIAAAIL
jgi:adenosylcobinamide-GDP ribazoletransferase